MVAEHVVTVLVMQCIEPDTASIGCKGPLWLVGMPPRSKKIPAATIARPEVAHIAISRTRFISVHLSLRALPGAMVVTHTGLPARVSDGTADYQTPSFLAQRSEVSPPFAVEPGAV